MSDDKDSRERDRRASELLPGDVKQSLSDQKQAMLELMRKEDRAFRQRKIAAVMYWILAAILFWLPMGVAMRWPSAAANSTFQTLFPIAWVASFVLLAAGVVSTIALLMGRRPIRDAQILAALHDIDATLQRLVRDQDKQ